MVSFLHSCLPTLPSHTKLQVERGYQVKSWYIGEKCFNLFHYFLQQFAGSFYFGALKRGVTHWSGTAIPQLFQSLSCILCPSCLLWACTLDNIHSLLFMLNSKMGASYFFTMNFQCTFYYCCRKAQIFFLKKNMLWNFSLSRLNISGFYLFLCEERVDFCIQLPMIIYFVLAQFPKKK